MTNREQCSLSWQQSMSLEEACSVLRPVGRYRIGPRCLPYAQYWQTATVGKNITPTTLNKATVYWEKERQTVPNSAQSKCDYAICIAVLPECLSLMFSWLHTKIGNLTKQTINV